MKRALSTLFWAPALLFAASPCAAQFSQFGLPCRTVYDLALYGGSLYAATDTGVYVTSPAPPDSGWKLMGLAGRRVLSIHPHDVGPLSWTVTAGLDLPWDDTTTSRTWCLNPGTQEWEPTDDGMNRSDINSIRALDGFPSMAVCGETFAGGQGKVYVHAANGGSWDKVFDIGIGQVNAIATAGGMVMAGGETAIFAPFIARSFDKGTTWETAFPDMAGDNACDALAFGGGSFVYAGMEGAVIMSNDLGLTWTSAGLEGTPYYFYGIAADSIDRTVFAGGMTNTGEWGFYVLKDGQQPWVRLDPPWTVRGIRSLALLPHYLQGANIVFIGTDGDGVLAYQDPAVSVEESPHVSGAQVPGTFECSAYPNPFNGETVIAVRLLASGSTGGRATGGAPGVGTTAEADHNRMTVEIYDVLGRRLSTLHDGRLGPGLHRFTWTPRGIASGVYIARVTRSGAAPSTGSFQQVKILYVR